MTQNVQNKSQKWR